MNILTLNEISNKIYDVLDDKYKVASDVLNPEAILVRSYNMHEFPVNAELKAVARAGAGVNNIPLDKMTENNVVVFNTPGANANAVKELVICGMLLSCRNIIGGINWACSLCGNDVPKQVEKGKSKFGGIEIMGKTAGIIGLGAIGVLVANALIGLGMKVLGYDPYLTDTNKNNLHKDVIILELNEIFKKANFISLHVPLLDSTKNIIGDTAISMMQKDTTVLNFARDGLVDVDALKMGINSGIIRNYIVDLPTSDILNCDRVITLPHLGASTAEAEDNCAIMAANELKEYLEIGNIINSVNYPCIYKEFKNSHRLAVSFDKNVLSFDSIKDYFKDIKDVAFQVSERKNIGYILADSDNCLCDLVPILKSLNGINFVNKIRN